MSRRLCEKLTEWGLTQKYLGHDYIVYGVETIQKSSGPVLMKVLYLEIAKQFSTNAACVERDIRTAFAVLWKREEFRVFLHGNPTEKKPGNAKLLYLLAWYWEK